MKRFVLIAALPLLATACSFVETTPAGEGVAVRTADEVRDCRQIGTVSGSVLAKIAGFPRNAQTMAAETEMLARNASAEIGGDTIVPLGAVEDGRRNFAVYRCRP